MKILNTLTYLFLLLVFSTIVFSIMVETFDTANSATNFLLSILVVHFVICKIHAIKNEE